MAQEPADDKNIGQLLTDENGDVWVMSIVAGQPVFTKDGDTPDDTEALMKARKRKLASLIRAMELNPLIDNAQGMALLRSVSTYVEAYKYSDTGYTDLMTLLTSKAEDILDTYYTFLNTSTDDPDEGVTVLMAIGGILA